MEAEQKDQVVARGLYKNASQETLRQSESNVLNSVIKRDMNFIILKNKPENLEGQSMIFSHKKALASNGDAMLNLHKTQADTNALQQIKNQKNMNLI